MLVLTSLTILSLGQSLIITLAAKLGKMEFAPNVQNIITLIKMEFAAKLNLNVEFSIDKKVSVKPAIKDMVLLMVDVKLLILSIMNKEDVSFGKMEYVSNALKDGILPLKVFVLLLVTSVILG